MEAIEGEGEEGTKEVEGKQEQEPLEMGQGHRTPRTPTTPVADPSRTSPNPVG